ncbi:hypothetical protein CP523_04735 [Clostridium septicum]|uniref:Uncharacterized protein n=1 Tax=Clostridium septicum TaxID=1504 RepID=A0A9N7PLF8_CLOSE|nr:hypothetical protein CP523_04735 [Clostridium septicum]QAS61973.1 hypothetical protein EI377_15245 [Clostridium septicum]
MKNKDINLYDIFTRYSYNDIMKLLESSKSKEEKDFYANL